MFVFVSRTILLHYTCKPGDGHTAFMSGLSWARCTGGGGVDSLRAPQRYAAMHMTHVAQGIKLVRAKFLLKKAFFFSLLT